MNYPAARKRYDAATDTMKDFDKPTQALLNNLGKENARQVEIEEKKRIQAEIVKNVREARLGEEALYNGLPTPDEMKSQQAIAGCMRILDRAGVLSKNELDSVARAEYDEMFRRAVALEAARMVG